MEEKSLEQQIREAQARNHELAAQRDVLAKKFETQKRTEAYLTHLDRQNERLERNIAAMEGSQSGAGENDSNYNDLPD